MADLDGGDPLQALVEKWRDEALAGRDTLARAAGISDNAFLGQMATIMKLERCADDLEAHLSSRASRMPEQGQDICRCGGVMFGDGFAHTPQCPAYEPRRRRRRGDVVLGGFLMADNQPPESLQGQP